MIFLISMAVGERIKRVRNFRGITQKELDIAIGFDEKRADIRVAQYESNTRTPKEGLLRKIAEVLEVDFRSRYELLFMPLRTSCILCLSWTSIIPALVFMK